MNLKIHCFIFAVTLSIFANASVKPGHVEFIGKDLQYAGVSLVFEFYSNHIIPQTTPLVTLPVNDDGTFNFEFPLEKPVYALVELGRYRASIYLEPEMSYHLVFPPFEPKSQSERLNPHFQPEEVLLGIANEEARGLNRNITEFDAMFEFHYNLNAVDLFVHGNIEKAQEIEALLEERFTYDHPVFNRHKELSYMKLWHMTVRRRDRQLVYQYLSGRPVEYHLPVYWEVFNSIFKGFIPNRLADEIQQPLLSSMARQNDFNSIIDIAVQDTLFSPRELAEVIVLYGLYEAFYEKNLRESTILAIAQDASESASTEATREMASQFYQKLSMLRPGTAAPEFTLINQNGEYLNLSDFKDKFIYLNFMHTGNYSCLRDLQSLKQLHQMFNDQLHIVTIITDEDYEAMIRFLDRHPDYNWEFLHFASSPAVLFNYNIMALPSYYLINPNGILTLSPAPTPDENFRERFINVYRNWQREELRRNPPERRTLFR